ncbi:hypothetical protein AB0D74_47645 [Streptomyces sp. NPDC048278]
MPIDETPASDTDPSDTGPSDIEDTLGTRRSSSPTDSPSESG